MVFARGDVDIDEGAATLQNLAATAGMHGEIALQSFSLTVLLTESARYSAYNESSSIQSCPLSSSRRVKPPLNWWIGLVWVLWREVGVGILRRELNTPTQVCRNGGLQTSHPIRSNDYKSSCPVRLGRHRIEGVFALERTSSA